MNNIVAHTRCRRFFGAHVKYHPFTREPRKLNVQFNANFCFVFHGNGHTMDFTFESDL